MACGLPVIATHSLGPASIVDDGRTGWLVPPGDASALAGAIADAVGDAGERRRRGHLARAAASRRFSWAGVVARLANVMSDVLSEVTGVTPRRDARDAGSGTTG
jgi:glycosyltransferase involved in cell wall biosynthesis